MNAVAMNVVVHERTSPAPGGVAVLEVTGAGANAAVQRLLARALPDVGRVRLARLVEEDELLDEALVVVRRSGAIELHLHGSPAVVARVRRALCGDVPQSRVAVAHTAWADVARDALPAAVSAAGARILLDQAQGALDRALDALASDAAPAQHARRLVEAGRRAQPFIVPPAVVLAGPVNAGKSTLFNLLVGRERVLASDRPGTTRDAVRDTARDGDLVVELVDTAGRRGSCADAEGRASGASASGVGASRAGTSCDGASRESASAAKASRDAPIEPDTALLLEAAGQRLGRALEQGADLVLWCQPADGTSATGDATSRDAASRDAASRDAASRDAASRDAASREAASREATTGVLEASAGDLPTGRDEAVDRPVRVTLVTRSDLAPVPPERESVGLSAATDPSAARTTVWAAIRTALAVDPEPWSEGAPVAFDLDLIGALERAIEGGDDGVRAAWAGGAFAPRAAGDGHGLIREAENRVGH